MSKASGNVALRPTLAVLYMNSGDIKDEQDKEEKIDSSQREGIRED